MLNPAEREQVLYQFNDTSITYPGDEVFSELFSKQVKLQGNRAAIIAGSESLSYQQLHERSDRLAKYLLSKGIIKEDIIAVCLDRSVEMIIAILGIMKAGAAYLPVDPEYPSDRIGFMLEDAAVKIVLTNKPGTQKLSNILPSFNTVVLDGEWEEQVPDNITFPVLEPGNLAYVIYTSGSTGRPKGVLNEHKALVNRLKWAQSHFDLQADDVVLQKTTFCFDVSVWELLWPLMVGSKLVFAKPGGQKDTAYLESIINEQQVTTIHFVPSMLEVFLLEIEKESCPSLRRILCSGEELTRRQAMLVSEKLAHVSLFNLYGPTEAAIDVSCFDVPTSPGKIFIGKPVANTSLYVLDEHMEPCPIGTEGELYIGGCQVARGYLNRPELDELRFLINPYAKDQYNRLYRTGDLARWHPDGNLEYLGRSDDQVKIRGFRIELGEIENTILEHEGIIQCVVLAKPAAGEMKKLVAYVVSSSSHFDNGNLLAYLSNKLPEYMLPELIIKIDHMPLNSNGKTDRKALPEPGTERPELKTLFKAPESEMEKLLSALWKSILNLDKVGINDNFFDLGGNSLLALRFVALLKQEHQLNLPVTRLYQFPFIQKLAFSLSGKPETKRERINKKHSAGGDIAVIGMAGRFPGSNTISDLWKILISGTETTTFFRDEELDNHLPKNLINDPSYVKARGILSDADKFDPVFFGMNPRLAELMDPQQRIFLEISWEALESSGCLPDKYDGKIGVFAGSGSNTYYLNNVHTRQDLIAAAGNFQVSTLNEKDYVAMRTAYELNLKGPAVSVYSACSTSLLAIAQATESLRKGQCDAALAGGVSITAPVNSGHLYEEGAMLSKDGHCRPFDANATGTVFSDGAGVVLLKTREAAERDGDIIYAILKGVGLNNDGAGKASFTAPDPAGQADSIVMAIEDAGIEASSISYIEAHGTATPLGDPIEFEGLKIAFGTQDKKQFCAIGSIKSNMGHLTHAAGVAGFIKTVMSLYHKQIPPSLFFKNANPNIDFEGSPFYVNSHLKSWESTGVKRAGVSSFGVGGTNVHVILEEAPQPNVEKSLSSKPQLISWSARTEDSLNAYQEKLKSYLRENPSTQLSDITATLQQSRRDFSHRRFMIASDTDDLIRQLIKDSQTTDTKVISEAAIETAFIFPGQGSQYINMGRSFYNLEPAFKGAVDECAEILKLYLNEDIRDVLYPRSNDQAAEAKLQSTKYTQPALFVTEYAMAKLWMSWGILPAALAGHSIGEFVAAQLAGVFSLADALKVVSERAKLISRLPGGSMLAVKMPTGELEKLLPPDLSIAAFNSADLSVVSGTTESITTFLKRLSEKGFANRLLKTSHAFHSGMMDDIREDFRSVLSAVKLNPPRLALVSTVTGKWMAEAEAMSVDYWANHLRLPVKFHDAVKSLWEEPGRVLLEVGPGNAATIFARQQAKGTSLVAIAGFERRDTEVSEYFSVLNSLGKLWQAGISADWKSVNPTGRKTALPTYAFDRKRCWVEPGIISHEALVLPGANHIAEFPEGGQPKDLHQKSRRDAILEKIKTIIENSSGIDMSDMDHNLNFIEIGLDSLILTQIAITLKREFLPVSFRQLNEGLNTVNLLADFLESRLPAEDSQGTAASLTRNYPSTLKSSLSGLSAEEEKELSKPFGASPRIEKQISELSTDQIAFIQSLTRRYNQKTKTSKEYTQKHRTHMADPRVVSGFKPLTKELVYPVVAKRSKGSRIWDIDGNEYIDALNGFGSNMLGFQPDILVNAIKNQMDLGYEIGPQHELAGDVCRLICEFTSFDRAALCSTGSEAVLGTMRIARTVTGRSLVVAFSGSYHGIFDEVIVRGTKMFRSIPAAPGIMPEAVQNMLILDYGTEETLKIIRERSHEIAAVLVEPVQSRRPEFQPIEFLKEIRKLTAESGTVLIFDEVITGFRMHPGGAQALFGIKADLASYGKVIGGGLPIGVIAGKKEFMDALDGGSWQFGDSSTPETGVTYFAGTFVRHPLALIAAKTSLEYFKNRGPALQEELNYKAAQLMKNMNKICRDLRMPVEIVGYGSMWKIKFKEEIPYSELLFTLMRYKGIHIIDGFPCFTTESHTLEELDAISTAFSESINELIQARFLLSAIDKSGNFANLEIENIQPVEGARLGRDRDGNPAWFIADPENPGKYLQVHITTDSDRKGL